MVHENDNLIRIRPLETIEEFRGCIALQREAFALPDVEISPLRHFVITKTCGGFTLGAFAHENGTEKLVGFVHHLLAVKAGEIIGYSHMTAIAVAYQNAGIGAKLKWAQREQALKQGCRFIKWTFDPMQSRNAHFNINRLGARIQSYAENYYGSDFLTIAVEPENAAQLDSDRLFAEWELDAPHVGQIERGDAPAALGAPAREIEIPANWRALVQNDPKTARAEQLRVRAEFQAAFAENLVCAGFARGTDVSKYLLFKV